MSGHIQDRYILNRRTVESSVKWIQWLQFSRFSAQIFCDYAWKWCQNMEHEIADGNLSTHKQKVKKLQPFCPKRLMLKILVLNKLCWFGSMSYFIRDRPLMIWGRARRKSRKKNFWCLFSGKKNFFGSSSLGKKIFWGSLGEKIPFQVFLRPP